MRQVFWLPLSENPHHHSEKNDPFRQGVHSKIPLLSRGLKLSNSKPGCRVSALPFFCKIESTNGFLTSSSIKYVLFSASYFINPCFTAGKELSVENVFNSQTPDNDHLHICSLWLQVAWYCFHFSDSKTLKESQFCLFGTFFFIASAKLPALNSNISSVIVSTVFFFFLSHWHICWPACIGQSERFKAWSGNFSTSNWVFE